MVILLAGTFSSLLLLLWYCPAGRLIRPGKQWRLISLVGLEDDSGVVVRLFPLSELLRVGLKESEPTCGLSSGFRGWNERELECWCMQMPPFLFCAEDSYSTPGSQINSSVFSY